MSTIELHPGDHRAIVTPDGRQRFALRSFVTRETVEGWRVYVSDDKRVVTLEAILPKEES